MSYVLLFALLGQIADAPPLVTAQAVRELHIQDDIKRAAKLTGVVTHINPHYGDFFLQDSSAGIYIELSKLAVGLEQGDRVEVEGYVHKGGFAPCLVPTAVRKLGRAPLPDPEPYNLRGEESRWLDGQYVQTYGFVRSIRTSEFYTILSIITAEGVGFVQVPGVANAKLMQDRIGSTVRVRGVCVPRYDVNTRQITGRTVLFAQTPSAVELVAGLPPGLTSAPLEQFLQGFSAVPHPTARPIVLTGIATATIGDREFVLQDATGGAYVSLVDPTPLKVGQKVTVNGFLNIEPTRVLLENATVMKTEPGAMPAPLSAAMPLFSKKTFGRLIQVDGVVEKTDSRDDAFIVNLHNGPDRFQAVLRFQPTPAAFRDIEPQATVRVTGVAYAFREGLDAAETPVILLRSESDLEVLAPPPAVPVPSWWTTQRVTTLLAGCGGLLALGGLWVWLLRRQVRKQTELITAHFQRETQLNDSLRQAGKLEAVGRLAGGIAHDFNNLLTIIIGNSELATRALRPGDPARELVTTVCDAAEKAAAMTRQLLTFSRQGPVNLEPTDLNAALAEVETLLRRLIGTHIRLIVQPTPGLPAVMGESTLIHQILFNLAANARDAMPGGGQLTIRTSSARNDLSVPVVRLTVTDTGCGMDDATVARAFEPFFTTKDVGQGTGLGLATVYGALATLKGTIRIDSAVGRGTAFIIDLPPLAQAQAKAPPTIEPPAEPLKKRQAHILLVDDEDAVRSVCRLTLQMYGYTVVDSGSSKAALEIVRVAKEPFDLVVTDLVMPEMNGQEFGIALRELQPNLPILIVSGYPEDEVGRFLGQLQGVGILNKPFSPMHLAVKVQDMLEEISTQPQATFRAADFRPSRLPDAV